MSPRSNVRAASALLALAVAGPGAAQGYGSYGYGGPSLTSDAWPAEIVRRPPTLARGLIEVSAPLGVDLSPRGGERLVTAPLGVHAGVTDWLTAGIRHSRGLCLGGGSGGCSAAFDDLRADAVVRFYSAGPLTALYGADLAASFVGGAVALSANAQVEARLAYPGAAVVLAPSYGFGLNRRDTLSRISPTTFPLASSLAFGADETVPNRETVHLPLVAALQPASRLALAAGIALDALLDPVAGTTTSPFRVPAALAAVVTPARSVDLGLALTFRDLRGRSAAPRSDERVVQAFVAFRMAGPGSPAPAAPAAGAPTPPSAVAAVPEAPCLAPAAGPVAASKGVAPAGDVAAVPPAPQPAPETADGWFIPDVGTVVPIPEAAPPPPPEPGDRSVVAVKEDESRAPEADAMPVPARGGEAPAPVAGAAAAAPADAPSAPEAGYTIRIEGFSYAPLTLDAPPGATITVRNGDPVPHSVTSASAPREFVPGAVSGVRFDTGVFTTGDRSFTLPADARPGTVIPYYCTVHQGRMSTPNGYVRVVPAR